MLSEGADLKNADTCSGGTCASCYATCDGVEALAYMHWQQEAECTIQLHCWAPLCRAAAACKTISPPPTPLHPLHSPLPVSHFLGDNMLLMLLFAARVTLILGHGQA